MARVTTDTDHHGRQIGSDNVFYRKRTPHDSVPPFGRDCGRGLGTRFHGHPRPGNKRYLGFTRSDVDCRCIVRVVCRLDLCLLFKTPSLNTWARYNLVYVGMFVLLGGVSEALFTPTTTMAAVISANEAPNELIMDGLPMTVIFTLAASVVITAMWGRQWSRFFAVLLTFTVLVVTLGLNVSIIGLVDIPGSSLYVVAELLGLILWLNVVYLVVFVALEWRGFYSWGHAVKKAESG